MDHFGSQQGDQQQPKLAINTNNNFIINISW